MSQDSFRTDTPATGSPGDVPLPGRFANRSRKDVQVDLELVEQTRSQIRNLVQEISDLAKNETSASSFYEGFLVRITSALASVGGALWVRPSVDRPFELKYQINLSETGLASDGQSRDAHNLLLNQVATRAEPVMLPPRSGSQESGEPEGIANPTGLLLMFGTLMVDGQLMGLVEVFQRPGGGPATQRGYLRFLTQMSEVASDFLRNQKLRAFSREQQVWQSLEQFTRRIHSGLDTRQVAFALANESRRLLECDRISVATRQGQIANILSVSGLDSLERRSEQIKGLSRVVTAVLRAGKPVWHSGDSSGLAPQIESQLQPYLDKSQSRMIAILPLTDSRGSDGTDAPELLSGKGRKPAPPRIIGALVLENLHDSQISQKLRERAKMVCEHASLALGNSLEHNSIFLMPVWKQLSWMSAPFAGSKLPRTMFAVCVVAALAVLMCIFPWSFTLGSKGQLIAQRQQEIYARVGGTLVDVIESDDPLATVPAGTLLAKMVNYGLLQEIESITGKLNESNEQIAKLHRALGSETESKNQILLSGDLEAEKQNERSLRQTLELLKRDADALEVRSPIDGRIANWQLRRNLLGRPVEFGQNLMTMVAPDSPWQVELYVPEKRVGHLLKRMNNSDDPVPVSFTLASRPGVEFEGTVISIDQVMDVHDDQGNSARVLVGFDNQQLADDLKRSGTRVTARLYCGVRPVGYVLFRELIETANSTWKFWF